MILQLQGVQGGAVVGVVCFVFSLFLTLGLEGLGWGYSQGFPFFDHVDPLCLYPADIQRGLSGALSAVVYGVDWERRERRLSLDRLGQA